MVTVEFGDVKVEGPPDEIAELLRLLGVVTGGEQLGSTAGWIKISYPVVSDVPYNRERF